MAEHSHHCEQLCMLVPGTEEQVALIKETSVMRIIKKSRNQGILVLFLKPYKYKVSESKKKYPHNTVLAQVAMIPDEDDKDDCGRVHFEMRSFHTRDLELVTDEEVKKDFLKQYKEGAKCKLKNFDLGDVVLIMKKGSSKKTKFAVFLREFDDEHRLAWVEYEEEGSWRRLTYTLEDLRWPSTKQKKEACECHRSYLQHHSYKAAAKRCCDKLSQCVPGHKSKHVDDGLLIMITPPGFAITLFSYMHTVQLDLFLIILLLLDVIATISELFLEIRLLKHERKLEGGFCGLDMSHDSFFCYGTEEAYTGQNSATYMEQIADAEEAIHDLEQTEHALGYLGAIVVSVFVFENIIMILLVGRHFFKDTIRVFDLVISTASLAFIILFYMTFQDSLVCEAKQLEGAASYYHHAYAGGSSDGHRYLGGVLYRMLNSGETTAAPHHADSNHTNATGCGSASVELYHNDINCDEMGVAALAGPFLILFRAWRFVRVMHGIYTETEKLDTETMARTLQEDMNGMTLGFGGSVDALQQDLGKQRENWENMGKIHDIKIDKMQLKLMGILKGDGFNESDAHKGQTKEEWQVQEVGLETLKLKSYFGKKLKQYQKVSLGTTARVMAVASPLALAVTPSERGNGNFVLLQPVPPAPAARNDAPSSKIDQSSATVRTVSVEIPLMSPPVTQ